MSSLIIVESPTKAKTIKRYVGSEDRVLASVGHIKDLPKKDLGVNIKDDFRPNYEFIKGKKRIVNEIRKAAKEADTIYLAPDPDREGEAIAWHIAEVIKHEKKPIYRALFNELTQSSIRSSLLHPEALNRDKYEAQQARRILDRLVGYQISPILWDKVRRGLSAGRVQSVALRLICEREREIGAFVQKEYWTVEAVLEGRAPPSFEAKLFGVNDEKVELLTEKETLSVIKEIEQYPFVVKNIEKKQNKRSPSPPFITSKLQQEAARKLKFSAKKTMSLAQQLYEGIGIGERGPVGLITYMRTDSVRTSAEALNNVRSYIEKKYGPSYLPSKPAVYRSKKGAQEAHEAIRPTCLDLDPESIKGFLTKDQYHLYSLIWKRYVASQMTPALYDQTVIEIHAGKFRFKATGSLLVFQGFMIIYTEGRDEDEEAEEAQSILPDLSLDERLTLLNLIPEQHFTQPPPRYTEAMLVKALEEKGIGRPSTYATIMSTIREKEYVEYRRNHFMPTPLGLLINDLLVENFPDILNVGFTAQLEEKLDDIEEGRLRYPVLLKEFHTHFEKELERAQERMVNVKIQGIPTEVLCQKCGKTMVVKRSQFGIFLGCSGYPECKNTKRIDREKIGEGKDPEPVLADERCERCGSSMVIRSGRFGKFLSCSRYPECRETRPFSTGIPCPEAGCTGFLVQRRTKKGRYFYGCTRYPRCRYATWHKPVSEACPQCNSSFLVEKISEGKRVLICPNKGCDFTSEPDALEGES